MELRAHVHLGVLGDVQFIHLYDVAELPAQGGDGRDLPDGSVSDGQGTVLDEGAVQGVHS